MLQSVGVNAIERVQAFYFALYSGKRKTTIQIPKKFDQNCILSLIHPDGFILEEMARPLFCSSYNLHAVFLVVNLAEKIAVDIWKANDVDSRLRASLEYLIPYTDPEKPWPHPTIRECDRMEIFTMLHMANYVNPKGDYLKFEGKLPMERRKTHGSNLIIPLMQ